MQNCTPSYSFSMNNNQQRTFHHRWHANNGQIYECQTCRTTCAANESYAAHWQHDERRYAHGSSKQLPLLQQIDSEKIEKFILCNKNVRAAAASSVGDVAERHQFLLDAGMKAIPEFLKLMWQEADKLTLQLGLHVSVKSEPMRLMTKKVRNAKKSTKAKKSKLKRAAEISAACEAFEAVDLPEISDAAAIPQVLLKDMEVEPQQLNENSNLLFKSSFLTIDTHYDIEESVDVLLTMLLERIERHLTAINAKIKTERNEYEVLRIELNLKRHICADNKHKSEEKTHHLPLQYSVKHACYSSNSQIAEKTLEFLYEEATAGTNIMTPCTVPTSKLKANFYTFKTCRYTGELFVVPYWLSVPTNALETPNFIMTASAGTTTGQSQKLLLIKNLRKFLRHEMADSVLNCKCCDAKFMQQTKLELHRRLQCGRDFKVIKMAADCVELYERCVPLQCAAYNWPLYGIVEKC